MKILSGETLNPLLSMSCVLYNEMEKMGMLIRTFTAPYLYHRGLILIRCFVVEALKEITEYPEITIRPS